MTKRAIREAAVKEFGRIRNLRIDDSKTNATFEIFAYSPAMQQYKPFADWLECKSFSISFIADPLMGTVLESARPRAFPGVESKIEVRIEGIGLAR